MRAYILCDYEGTTGTVTWDEENSLGPQAMAGDINATIEGLAKGGFTEFVARDYHASGLLIHPADINPQATLIRGKPTPYPYGLDYGFDAMCFVGAHTMQGTANGVMSHTMNGEIFELHINGRLIGEIGGFAYLAGHFDIPMIFVSGDEAACDEANEIIGNVETSATKFGITRNCAECLHPSVSRERITEAAYRAAKRMKDLKPLKCDLPCVLEVTYRNSDSADRVFETSGGERIDGRTVRITAETALDAFRRFERGFM